MQGKYSNVATAGAAWVRRELLRARLDGAVHWEPLAAARPGCTVVVGMCSRLPHVLAANLRCLASFRWPELTAVVVAVDAVDMPERQAIEARAKHLLPDIPVDFVYYSARQSAIAERLRLPFVYSWMSWCRAIGEVGTRDVLIHDYDALILGPGLERRYREFVDSGATVQGIRWYDSNGVRESDRLCTTFEMFVDASWIRSLSPLELFNKIRFPAGRSIDYDTTLDAQARRLDPQRRCISPMSDEDLVHPSQMIHQYTMFRRQPAGDLPCFAMPMIPFFSALGGKETVGRAAARLATSPHNDVDLFGDGTRVNLERLDMPQVDWSLKQMVQACLKLSIEPYRDLHRYGAELYRSARAPASMHWKGDFTPRQRQWIDDASVASSQTTP